MGAMPWNIVGPYDSNADKALRLLQHQYFDENYDLTETLGEVIADAQACVDAVQEHDEYGLLGTYTATLADVQEIAAEDIPGDKDGQIEMLRRLVNASGEPLNNILDIRGVSDRLKEWYVVPLSDSQLNEFFSTSRPTSAVVDEIALSHVYSILDRAQTVSFPVYGDPSATRPTAIMYVGYTAD